jgi:hypothetical protein
MSTSLPKQWLDKASEDLVVAGGKPSGLPTKSEAEEAVNAADKLFHFIAVHIP